MMHLFIYHIVSCITYVFSTFFSRSYGDQVLLKKLGEVSQENFVYFSVMNEGVLKIVLHSLQGDADVYVAQNSKLPTFDPQMYDLHSATCGSDVVHIPESFKRPVVIGVYGHPGQEVTKFHLFVVTKNSNSTHTQNESEHYKDEYEHESEIHGESGKQDYVKYVMMELLGIISLFF